MTSATPHRVQLTREKAAAYLGEDAPADPAQARKVAIKVHSAFIVTENNGFGKRSLDEMAIMRAMREHWSPRLEGPMETDALLAITGKLAADFAASEDRRAAERSAKRQAAAVESTKRREAERAAEQSEKAKRVENAETVKAVAARFKITTRRAQQLLREGTTKVAQAAVLAELTGADAATFMRQPGKPGRSADNDTWLMRRYWDGASFRDFVREPPELEEEPAALLDAFASAYRRAALPDHLKELEAVTTFAQSAGAESDVAIELWGVYTAWRRERIASMILDGTHDPYDFG